MNSSLPRRFSSGLIIVLLMAAGSCATRSVIGQQTGQGRSEHRRNVRGQAARADG